ncbi:MAG: polysaccharide deacetylase family protein [Verrucomicrobia bacterium]|nr:polysaccharide deacetylase family protein [Verrucomicrobiota bacterium]
METKPKPPEAARTCVAFVFDDGFTASCERVARIFEARGLAAVFAVLVNHDGFMPAFPKGDFGLWNELQARGHVIHPHGLDHTDLTKVPHTDAVARIDACLAAFGEKLNGFDPARAIYHFTYNRSTPALEAHLLGKVRALRTTGTAGAPGTGFNSAADLTRRVLSCAWHGPDACDEHLLATLRRAAAERPPLMLYVLHGLDGEGWGSLGSATLERVLDELVASEIFVYDALSLKLIPQAVPKKQPSPATLAVG